MQRVAALKRRNDPSGLQQRVLDVAFKTFQAHGYQATSIQDVMKGAAVSGGALHHHFPSKKSMGLAVVRERVAPAVREAWIDPIRKSKSLHQGVAVIFKSIAEGIDARGVVLGCPLNNLTLELANSDAEIRSALSAIFSEWQLAIADRIAELYPGALGLAARQEIACTIISTYSGAMTMAKVQQNVQPLRMAAASLNRWLRSVEPNQIARH